MSCKISVVSISIALLSLLFCSCSIQDCPKLSVFESSFSADITVKNEDGEYEATLTLADGSVIDTANDGSARDGNIVYTSPETVGGISAVRMGGEVTVNVCGIQIKPSANIASKYTALLDMLDISSAEVGDAQYSEYEGAACVVYNITHDQEPYQVYIDRTSEMPLMLKCADMTVLFRSFTRL